jgi:hypothetical protein
LLRIYRERRLDLMDSALQHDCPGDGFCFWFGVIDARLVASEAAIGIAVVVAKPGRLRVLSRAVSGADDRQSAGK